MMKERGLSRSLRLIFSGGAVVSLGLLAHSVQAQQAKTDDTPQPVQRIEVTGSSIKRVANEGVSPITIIKADDFAKQGITTASEALGTISANQSQFTTASNVGRGGTAGATADLRALGSNKTLVLLNGRRLANSAFDGSTVDLNIIPIAALDRVEVLRDGASAIYGTDAIGGVINFITKRSYTGLNLSTEGIVPSQSGGKEGRINVSGGHGDLGQDGYNFFGVIDYHHQRNVRANQRGITGVVPSLGLNNTSGNTFPANFVDTGNQLAGNPLLATGCHAPFLMLTADGASCRYMPTATVDIVPDTTEIAVIGKGTFKLNADNKASIEYLHSESKVRQVLAGDVFSGNGTDYLIPSSSKYYPGNGITPAVAGLSGNPLSVNFRSALFGGRRSEAKNTADRLLLSLDGTAWNWDYKTGLSYAVSKATESLLSGYLINNGVRAGLSNGTLNPFGPQAASEAGVLTSIQNEGKYLDAKTTIAAIDFTASREIAQLPAGPLGFAIGGEYRHETAAYNVIHEVASLSDSTGSATAKSQSGARNVGALFTELSVPIVKNLEAQLALRYDDYSDVGSTVNPKVGVRWQPARNLMIRSSYSTGFRAPSLYELNQPNSTTYTAGTGYNDPKLCPGGVLAPGGVRVRDCNTQFFTETGGNKNLQPEKSTSFSLGTVFEPVKNVTASIDYFNIKIKNQIGVINEADIFANSAKYQDLYVRKPDGSLQYIVQTNQNLGNVHTQGFDLGLGYNLPKTAWGNFGFSIDGTYVTKYDYQSERNGPYLNNLGEYANGQVIFRWRHNATVKWSQGPWSVMFQQTYATGYQDANPATVAPGFDHHRVDSYTRYNTSVTYTGIKNLTLTGGIKNLFNSRPPLTNQIDNFQISYDPRYSDIIGRAFFIRANYQFF